LSGWALAIRLHFVERVSLRHLARFALLADEPTVARGGQFARVFFAFAVVVALERSGTAHGDWVDLLSLVALERLDDFLGGIDFAHDDQVVVSKLRVPGEMQAGLLRADERALLRELVPVF